jgi:protocatechuate 3,4-dioxygenase beta subunit
MFAKTRKSFGKAGRLHGALAVLAVVSMLTITAAARNQEGQLRTVRGTVVDSSDTPLASAIVYLKNLRTLGVRTYISDNHGQYRFSGLDPNVDYELHAEHGRLTSSSHTVSSFDSRHDIVILLKVNRKKSE